METIGNPALTKNPVIKPIYIGMVKSDPVPALSCGIIYSDCTGRLGGEALSNKFLYSSIFLSKAWELLSGISQRLLVPINGLLPEPAFIKGIKITNSSGAILIHTKFVSLSAINGLVIYIDKPQNAKIIAVTIKTPSNSPETPVTCRNYVDVNGLSLSVNSFYENSTSYCAGQCVNVQMLVSSQVPSLQDSDTEQPGINLICPRTMSTEDPRIAWCKIAKSLKNLVQGISLLDEETLEEYTDVNPVRCQKISVYDSSDTMLFYTDIGTESFEDRPFVGMSFVISGDLIVEASYFLNYDKPVEYYGYQKKETWNDSVGLKFEFWAAPNYYGQKYLMDVFVYLEGQNKPASGTEEIANIGTDEEPEFTYAHNIHLMWPDFTNLIGVKMEGGFGGNVIITWVDHDNFNKGMATLLSVSNENVITIKNSVIVSEAENDFNTLDFIFLSEKKVISAYVPSSIQKGLGNILTIGSSLVSKEETEFFWENNSVSFYGTPLIDKKSETEAIVVFPEYSTGYGKICILTLNEDDTVSIGPKISFITEYIINPIITVLSNTRGFILYRTSNNYLRYCSYLIFEGSFIFGSKIVLTSYSTSQKAIKMPTNDDIVFFSIIGFIESTDRKGVVQLVKITYDTQFFYGTIFFNNLHTDSLSLAAFSKKRAIVCFVDRNRDFTNSYKGSFCLLSVVEVGGEVDYDFIAGPKIIFYDHPTSFVSVTTLSLNKVLVCYQCQTPPSGVERRGEARILTLNEDDTITIGPEIIFKNSYVKSIFVNSFVLETDLIE